MKVTQMTSVRTGKPVANQFVLWLDDCRAFQSYRSIIAKVMLDGSVLLDSTYWDYSKTTSRYRNEFLGEDTKTIKAKIASGVYKLTNLN